MRDRRMQRRIDHARKQRGAIRRYRTNREHRARPDAAAPVRVAVVVQVLTDEDVKRHAVGCRGAGCQHRPAAALCQAILELHRVIVPGGILPKLAKLEPLADRNADAAVGEWAAEQIRIEVAVVPDRHVSRVVPTALENAPTICASLVEPPVFWRAST